MDITIMEGLYMALLFFWTLVLILISVVLVKIIKILWPVMELVWLYNRAKQFLWMYSQIPDSIKEKVFSFIKK